MSTFPLFLGLCLLLSLYFTPLTSTSHVHIVYLGLVTSHDPFLTTKSHVQLLATVFPSENDAKKAMLYSYKHSFSGFSSILNTSQASALAGMEGVISVFRSKTLHLHTTRSWDFMGLSVDHSEALMPLQLAHGDDVVIGVLDTGIWPESQSFREEHNMGPIPSSWKGQCIKGEKFDPKKHCNKKLIGARYYLQGLEAEYGPLNTSANPEYRSPRDQLGHGTHTASTAAGAVVRGVGFVGGLGGGVARGGAPRARLAVYKICWSVGLFQDICTEADIMAAFDEAVADGVNVISASFGTSPPLRPFFMSASDIGSFHAAQLGISVVFSAGNDGPDPSLVSNVAPWSTCVAASDIDRMFQTRIQLLGDGTTLMGESFNIEHLKLELPDPVDYFMDGDCEFNKRTGEMATGKVILCFSTIRPQLSGNAALAVLVANGSAMIFASPRTRQIPEVVDLIPVIYVDIAQGTKILHYIQSQLQQPKVPMVEIFPSKTTVGVSASPAPKVAYFSSRGPNSLTPNILKPDISAPGVNILAAWPPSTPPSLLPFDTRSLKWNFESGTSMSCPHVSGITALIKSLHPSWSPAAIKSAIMTTAYTSDTSLDMILAGGSAKTADPFDMGAGHVNPLKAIDPGLVYDMSPQDYVLFLCSIGYTKTQIARMVLTSACIDINCPKQHQSDSNFNYPSITVSDLRYKTTIKRTVWHVGQPPAIYFVQVVNPNGVKVDVWPRVMVFNAHKQEASYFVTLTPLKTSQGRYDFGEIVWFDGFHHVRSPLIVCVNNTYKDVVSGTESHSSS